MTVSIQKTHPMTAEREDHYFKIARNIALQAGKIQMDSYGKAVPVSTKATSIDLVTAIDRECDLLISTALREACPTDLILTEEQFQEGQSVSLENTWVVDPLDGTTNYAHGFPHFAVSIAYFFQGKPHIGVVYDPNRKELFHAIHNRGAFLNGQPITVSNERVTALSKALLATGFPYDIASSTQNNLNYFSDIAPRCQGVRRPGAAALDLAYLACGRIDGYWELKLSLWDMAAGVLLVEEAGGRVNALDGGQIPYTQRHIHLLSSNGTGLHQELQTRLDTVSQSE